MNAWQIAAWILPFAILAGAAGALRGGLMGRVASVQVVSGSFALELAVLSRAYGSDFLLDLALVLVVLGSFGALAWARMLERWL